MQVDLHLGVMVLTCPLAPPMRATRAGRPVPEERFEEVAVIEVVAVAFGAATELEAASPFRRRIEVLAVLEAIRFSTSFRASYASVTSLSTRDCSQESW